MIAALPIDAKAHAAVGRLGRPALAWEVLRRDPAYRAAFSEMTLKAGNRDAADPAFSARWGSHFP